MASQTRQREREESSRLSLRTLVIASVASATAAVVTSQFWVRGTWIAAAMTPVIVALVQELLHRPTERIATRLTADRAALDPRPRRRAHAGVREELGAPREASAAERAAQREAERSARAAAEAPVSVYGRGPRRPTRRKVAIGAVAATGVLAFAVAAVALSVPELITGQSLGGGDNATTLFGGKARKKRTQETQPQTTTPEQQRQQQSTQPEEQKPDEQPQQQTQPQEETTPTTPPTETQGGGTRSPTTPDTAP
jgi:hypothetical protein